MPDINVLKVEVRHSDQYGDKKILHVDDGSKWNVTEKKPFYGEVKGPGIYSADFKDYQGKPYISWLKFKGALNAQNQATTAPAAASGTGSTQSNYDANLKLRLAADKKRQDDIRLEFYCGVAKDILIANKEDGQVINPSDVINLGVMLYKSHLESLEILDLQAQGKAEAAKSHTGTTTYSKAEEALKKAEAAEEEPPF